MATATLPTVTVDPEVLAHADAIGLRAALDHMVEATPRLYPAARSIRVLLRPDHQYPQMNITWWIEGPYPAGGEWPRARREWDEEFARVVPAPRDHHFYLVAPGT
ncbi:MAG: hypothetical protein ACRC33_30550 [Gemmataceae bacterium]